MNKIGTAYTMALLPRAARPGPGQDGRIGAVVTPAESFLSLSSGILRLISAAEGLWQSAGDTRARLRGHGSPALDDHGGVARC